MICPDFVQYNSCQSSKCGLPHLRINSDVHVQGSKDREKRKSSTPRRRSSATTIVSSVSRKRGSKKGEAAQTITAKLSLSDLVNPVPHQTELVKPILVNDPKACLDFIPLSSSCPSPPPEHASSPSSPSSNGSNDDDDCDLSMLPSFIANMIKNDDYDDESDENYWIKIDVWIFIWKCFKFMNCLNIWTRI